MNKLVFSVLWLFCGAFANAGATLSPKNGTVVSECKSPKATKRVWIFEQWHLSPSVDTKHPPIPKPAQKESQLAIYRQLESWIQAGSLKTLYAEGCSGALDENFGEVFNGWTIQDLKSESSKPGYSEILTHIPMKLEAKFGLKLNTICADDSALLKEGSLALSDARGTIGYATRLKQYGDNPKRAKPYLDDVIRMFKMPQDTTPAKAVVILKDELKKAIARFYDSLNQRNDRFVEVIRSSALDGDAQALVIGGAHSKDLVTKLEKAGIGCKVVEPVGYSSDVEKLVSELEKALSKF